MANKAKNDKASVAVKATKGGGVTKIPNSVNAGTNNRNSKANLTVASSSKAKLQLKKKLATTAMIDDLDASLPNIAGLSKKMKETVTRNISKPPFALLAKRKNVVLALSKKQKDQQKILDDIDDALTMMNAL
ncbi:hypothetical protein HK100_000664 [Physocladia obscura]|uniref:Uncharacterized protein n=1 Tax=Physocladia obscura TaxID=109957 RepID=A0AAD5XCE4_9FUNG|nr:hypothetical protein HK100_000664 [Physocladia obscura]